MNATPRPCRKAACHIAEYVSREVGSVSILDIESVDDMAEIINAQTGYDAMREALQAAAVRLESGNATERAFNAGIAQLCRKALLTP